jgi:hypothetical protein
MEVTRYGRRAQHAVEAPIGARQDLRDLFKEGIDEDLGSYVVDLGPFLFCRLCDGSDTRGSFS